MTTRKYHRKSNKFRKIGSKRQRGGGPKSKKKTKPQIVKKKPQIEVTNLIYESRYGNINEVKKILKEIRDTGVDVNTINERYKEKYGYDSSNTALHLAIDNGHTEIAKLLLNAGVDANVNDKSGDTALQLASKEGYTEIVKLLLEKGADVNTKYINTGETALIKTSKNKDTKIAAMLLAAGADINETAKNGGTALSEASIYGHPEMVEYLLENGADVNATKKYGETALILASLNGHTECVRILLEKKADVTAKTNDDLTALQKASQRGNIKIVEMLLDAGADDNVKDKKAYIAHIKANMALIEAIKNGRTEVVRGLLEKENGADANVKIYYGSTVLHLASKEGHTEIVKLLLDNGANVIAQDVNDKTALELVEDKINESSDDDSMSIDSEVSKVSKEEYTEIVGLLKKQIRLDAAYELAKTPLSLPVDVRQKITEYVAGGKRKTRKAKQSQGI